MFAEGISDYGSHLKPKTDSDLSQMLKTAERHCNDNKMFSDLVSLHLYF